MSACALGWLGNLNENRSLMVFAALWSMLAPAWTVLIDRFENNASFIGHIWRMDFPFSSLTEFAMWTGSNFIFLWTGMLLYLIPEVLHRRALSKRQIRRAIFVPLVMFNALYVGLFVLMNLFSYPGPGFDRRTITALGEIVDVRQWAVVLRLPYLLTMLCALWKTNRFAAAAPSLVVELAHDGPSTSLPDLPMSPPPDSEDIEGPVALFVGAGLLNSIIASILLCRLPESHAPSVAAVLMRAALYVLCGALAGVGGAWFYWRRSSSSSQLVPAIPFRRFALICAAAWIWVPAAMLFAAQDSPFAAGIAALGAVILAIGLRKTLRSSDRSVPDRVFDPLWERELFAASLSTPRGRSQGYIIAVSIYCGAYALRDRSMTAASALLALAAFIFAWEIILPPSRRSDCWENRRAALRLARIAIPAVLVTAWALLDGIAHRDLGAVGTAFAGLTDPSKRAVHVANPAADISGYESIVLWPFPEKKQIVPPLPAHRNLLAPGTSEPLVIRFDGPYFFFQPGRRPGSTAHQAQGSPLAVNIESTNSLPLSIEAHQSLVSPIFIKRCREMEIEIRNRDNQPGTIALAVLLSDSTTPRKSLYLGQEPLQSTQPGHFSIKTLPVYETIRFAIPADADIRKFDQITVMLLPDIEHALVAPRIAITQFELFSR